MHARFFAALLALLLLWTTGGWMHEVQIVPAESAPALSVADRGPAPVQGSIADHHLDDQGGATLDHPPDGASPRASTPAAHPAHARPEDAASVPRGSPHLPGPQRPPRPAHA